MSLIYFFIYAYLNILARQQILVISLYQILHCKIQSTMQYIVAIAWRHSQLNTIKHYCLIVLRDDRLDSARCAVAAPADWLICAGRSTMIESELCITVYIFVCPPINQDEKYRYICTIGLIYHTYLRFTYSSALLSTRKVQSHIASQKQAARTYDASTVHKPFLHALPHAPRTCGSAIFRTCAPQPNICL